MLLNRLQEVCPEAPLPSAPLDSSKHLNQLPSDVSQFYARLTKAGIRPATSKILLDALLGAIKQQSTEKAEEISRFVYTKLFGLVEPLSNLQGRLDALKNNEPVLWDRKLTRDEKELVAQAVTNTSQLLQSLEKPAILSDSLKVICRVLQCINVVQSVERLSRVSTGDKLEQYFTEAKEKNITLDQIDSGLQISTFTAHPNRTVSDAVANLISSISEILSEAEVPTLLDLWAKAKADSPLTLPGKPGDELKGYVRDLFRNDLLPRKPPSRAEEAKSMRQLGRRLIEAALAFFDQSWGARKAVFGPDVGPPSNPFLFCGWADRDSDGRILFGEDIAKDLAACREVAVEEFQALLQDARKSSLVYDCTSPVDQISVKVDQVIDRLKGAGDFWGSAYNTQSFLDDMDWLIATVIKNGIKDHRQLYEKLCGIKNVAEAVGLHLLRGELRDNSKQFADAVADLCNLLGDDPLLMAYLQDRDYKNLPPDERESLLEALCENTALQERIECIFRGDLSTLSETNKRAFEALQSKAEEILKESLHPNPISADSESDSQREVLSEAAARDRALRELYPAAHKNVGIFLAAKDALVQDPLCLHHAIVSLAHNTSDVLECLFLTRVAGMNKANGPKLPITALSETPEDILAAGQTCEAVLNNRVLRPAIESWGTLTWMFGYSDGGMRAGFASRVMARAAEGRVMKIGQKYGVRIYCEKGVGPEPGRGGGRFSNAIFTSIYAIMSGRNHVTIQGQGVPDNFGTVRLALRSFIAVFRNYIRGMIMVRDEEAVKRLEVWREKYQAAFQESAKMYDALIHRYELSSRPSSDKATPDDMLDAIQLLVRLSDMGRLMTASRPLFRTGANGAVGFDDLRAVPNNLISGLSRGGWVALAGVGRALSLLTDEDSLHETRMMLKEDPEFRADIEAVLITLQTVNIPLVAAMVRANYESLEKQDKRVQELFSFFTALEEDYDLLTTSLEKLLAREDERKLLALNTFIAVRESKALKDPITTVLQLLQLNIIKDDIVREGTGIPLRGTRDPVWDKIPVELLVCSSAALQTSG